MWKFLNNEKILKVTEEEYNKIINKLTKLSSLCKDPNTVSALIETVEFMKKLIKDKDEPSIEELILSKLKETKGKDPDLNASLYILYQNLKRGRVTEEEALELYEKYDYTSKYNKLIY
jgi:protein subunit release factor A